MKHTDPSQIRDFARVDHPEDLVHRLIYDDGSVYTGHTINKLRHGFGKLTYQDGSVYEGFFKSDKFHGEGTYIHHNGDTYSGNFSEGKATGYGTLFQKNGLKYEGEWKGDYQHGFGREFWSLDPRTGEYLGYFEGKFKRGKKCGEGVLIFPQVGVRREKRSRFVGNFQDNMIDGYGELTFQTGRIYKGQWSKNRITGKGAM